MKLEGAERERTMVEKGTYIILSSIKIYLKNKELSWANKVLFTFIKNIGSG